MGPLMPSLTYLPTVFAWPRESGKLLLVVTLGSEQRMPFKLVSF